MAIVVKWLTQRIVAPSLVGSNPISRPIRKKESLVAETFFVGARSVTTLTVSLRQETDHKKACTVTVHA